MKCWREPEELPLHKRNSGNGDRYQYVCAGGKRDMFCIVAMGFPCGSAGKESACNAGDLGLIPGLGRSPGEGNGYPLSILAWRIPRTEEPGGLQSRGSQRVGHE